jgi:hypothetical protein
MSNMLSNKLKNQVIYSYIKIRDPPKCVVFMSKIDQSMEVSKHIILETRMVVTIHPYISPSQIFTMAMKSQTNTSDNWANLSKE